MEVHVNILPCQDEEVGHSSYAWQTVERHTVSHPFSGDL